jgi:hypothetical protein
VSVADDFGCRPDPIQAELGLLFMRGRTDSRQNVLGGDEERLTSAICMISRFRTARFPDLGRTLHGFPAEPSERMSTIILHRHPLETRVDELSLSLVEAYRNGTFLKAVDDARRAEKCQGRVATALAEIHNSGAVDVIAAFENLENQRDTGISFFLTLDLFKSALPDIESAVQPVMATVMHLYKAAGTDLAAGVIFNGFVDFCAKDPSRPATALQAIEADPGQFVDALPAVLIAGSRLEGDRYYLEAIRLIGSGPMALRQRAAFAIGKLAAPTGPTVFDAAIAALEAAANSEKDGISLAAIIKSAVELLQRSNELEARVLPLLDRVLASGDDHALHAGAEIFATVKSVSGALRNLLLSHLFRVNAESKGTLRHIDFGISQMLNSPERDKGVEFLERYLLAHPGLELQTFEITMHQVANDLKMVGTLATRWFLRGDHALGLAIATIIREFHGKSPTLEIDQTELQPCDSVHIVFLARKIVGYLYLFPVTAASLVVSLMKKTDDDTTLEALGTLLYDPLLMSYPGSAADFVTQEAKTTSGKVKATLQASRQRLESYLNVLKSMPDLPALHPSEEQREVHQRRHSRLMAKSYKEAQKASVLLNLVHKSVLLYGDRAVFHVPEPGGQSRRIESEMKRIGTSFEFPRMDVIDPVGLDHFLRTCKSEVIKQ